MAIKKIITLEVNGFPDKESEVLRTSYTEVKEFDERAKTIIADLIDTLHSDSLSVGLAAPQIGYPEAIVVLNLEKNVGEDLVLINPKVVSESGQLDKSFESCMSIPHKKGKVNRRKKVTVSYQDQDGSIVELKASSFFARVLMHEIDHVNGILFVDRMDKVEKLEDTDIFRNHGIS